ncbi:MAG TPA: hypothetical protein VJ872_01540 [Nocardioides sp.]|nr:hypothetical protein [Nocardioides sp.]
MHHAEPIPQDKVRRLVLLIAITFAVLSVVTIGPARARFEKPHPAPVPQPTHQVTQQLTQQR